VASEAEHLEFKERSGTRIVMQIHPEANFRRILFVLNAIRLPEFVLNGDNVKYAILELLNNSLRAHREKKIDRRILTVLVTGASRLEVSVKDYGGGFDPRALPYDLDSDPQSIDHTSLAFQEYQQKNDYLRFGMGLLVVKRTFDDFSLSFFDAAEEPVSWESGAVCGTLVTCVTEGAGRGQ
jgi:anti-sigma regulatory factor (Ser/Thr protein kinase)